MKQGDVIRGYRVLGKPTNTDAGKCLWAFAEKDGREFFVKEFLDPRRPREGFMGSPQDRLAIDAQCDEFEQRHRSVNDRIDPKHLQGGNLVTPIDFFAERSRYYKVTARVRATGLEQPQALTPYRKRVLLGTLADSVCYLHSLGIVHGDLKPQNVLVHRPVGSDLHTAKLIDLDDAFPSGSAPDRTLIGGDPRYGAPEWTRYVRGDPEVGPGALTISADMFAFGLVAHIYLAGRLPGFDPRHGSPGAAVNAGEPLVFDARLGPDLLDVLRALADVRPTARPTIGDLQEVLEHEEKLMFRQVPRRIATAHRRGARDRAGKTGTTAGAGKSQSNDISAGGPRSRLRINLDGRTPKLEDEGEKRG